MAKRDLTLRVYSDGRQKMRWKATAGNGKQLARSARGYCEEEQIMADISWLLDEKRNPELYRDNGKKREWRWRIRNAIGRIVAIGSEGYVNKGDCDKSANLFLDATAIGEY